MGVVVMRSDIFQLGFLFKVEIQKGDAPPQGVRRFDYAFLNFILRFMTRQV